MSTHKIFFYLYALTNLILQCEVYIPLQLALNIWYPICIPVTNLLTNLAEIFSLDVATSQQVELASPSQSPVPAEIQSRAETTDPVHSPYAISKQSQLTATPSFSKYNFWKANNYKTDSFSSLKEEFRNLYDTELSCFIISKNTFSRNHS